MEIELTDELNLCFFKKARNRARGVRPHLARNKLAVMSMLGSVRCDSLSPPSSK